MKKLSIYVFSVALVFCMAVNVQATPITFDLCGERGKFDSLVYTDTVYGVVLTVTAETAINDTAINISRNTLGLGAFNPDDDGDQYKLDSYGPNEQLNFTFCLPTGFDALALESIEFTFFNDEVGEEDEDFALILDGSMPLGRRFTPRTNPWNVADDLTDLASRTFEDSFSIKATDRGGEEDFRISQLTVSPVPMPIPEPTTTLLLLGIGLMGLAGLGRKKFFRKEDH